MVGEDDFVKVPGVRPLRNLSGRIVPQNKLPAGAVEIKNDDKNATEQKQQNMPPKGRYIAISIFII
jgi:hypothetical protein